MKPKDEIVSDNLFSFVKDEVQFSEVSITAKKNPNSNENITDQNEKKQIFTCSYGNCNYSTNIKLNLRGHLERIHLQVLKYACSLCEYKSFYKPHVERHQNRKHANSNKKVLRIGCTFCEQNIDHSIHSNSQEKPPKTNSQGKPKKTKSHGRARRSNCSGEDCNYNSSSHHYKEHYEKFHMKLLRYFCKLCDYKNYSKTVVKTHLKDNHGGYDSRNVLKIGCTLCEQKEVHTKHSNTIKEKRQKHPNFTRSKCSDEDCNYDTSSHHYKEHFENVHMKLLRYLCKLCDYKNYSKTVVKIHLKDNHGGYDSRNVLKIGCTLCEQKVVHTKHINSIKEKRQMHPTSEGKNNTLKRKIKINAGKFSCTTEDCDYATNNKQLLRYHLESLHFKILRFFCNLCEYKSYYKQYVNSHQANNHQDNETKKVLKIGCTHCEQNLEHLIHSNSKKGRPPSNSNIKVKKLTKVNSAFDKFSFSKKGRPPSISNIKIKKLTKVKSKFGKFSCSNDECNYSTNSKQHYRQHFESKHLQIVKFSCNLCEYKSYHKQTVEYHQNTKHCDIEIKRVLKIGCTLCEQNSVHSLHSKSDKGSAVNKHNNEIKKVLRIGSPLDQSGISNSLKRGQEQNKDICFPIFGKFRCSNNDCNYSSNHKTHLREHFESVHLQLSRFACNLCEYKSYHKQTVKYHQNTMHYDNEIKRVLKIGCTLCEQNIVHSLHSNSDKGSSVNSEPKESVSKETLKNMRSRGGGREGKKIQCNECEHEALYTARELRKHYNSDHPGKFVFNCNNCKYGTNYLPNLKSHINSKHEKKEIQCQKCPYKTTWNQSFHLHMRKEHGFFQRNTKHNVKGEGQSYLCQKCGYSTFSIREFEEHDDIHTDIIVIRRKSGKVFQRRRLPKPPGIPKEKFSTFSDVDNKNRFKCNLCEYTTEYLENVKRHVRNNKRCTSSEI